MTKPTMWRVAMCALLALAATPRTKMALIAAAECEPLPEEIRCPQ